MKASFDCLDGANTCYKPTSTCAGSLELQSTFVKAFELRLLFSSASLM